ncbi:MAG: glycosyltransferase, partial [Pyrinomonadaceae bacterium]
MKRLRVIFVERKASGAVSVERVFRQIARDLPPESFDLEFQQVPFGNGILAILKNLLFFRPKPADIYHITGDVQYISLRLPGDRTVMTIHDIISLHQRSGLRRYIIKKLYFDLPFRRLSFITTISGAVRDEIAAETGIDAGRIRVIPNPLINDLAGHDHKPFTTERPVILHIGTAKNKNLDLLIDALADIDCKLRIVGRLDEAIIRKLELSSIIYENVYELDDVQMKQEYLDADILA